MFARECALLRALFVPLQSKAVLPAARPAGFSQKCHVFFALFVSFCVMVAPLAVSALFCSLIYTLEKSAK